MFVHFFDVDCFNMLVLSDNVDCSVRTAEPDRAVALPIPLQGMIAKSSNGACCLEPLVDDEVSPKGELTQNVPWHFGELLLGSVGNLKFHYCTP